METYIKNINKLETSGLLLQLKYILQKRHKNTQHLQFLYNAKKHEVTPNFLRINLPKRYTLQETKGIHKKLLQHEIKKQHYNKTMINSKLKYLHRTLLQKLHYIEYETVYLQLEEEITNSNYELDQKRLKKLNKLIEIKNQTQQQPYNSKTTHQERKILPLSKRSKKDITTPTDQHTGLQDTTYRIQEPQATAVNTKKSTIHHPHHTASYTKTTSHHSQENENNYTSTTTHSFPPRFTNLSTLKLNNEETQLLNLGHKYAPQSSTYSPYLTAIDIEYQLYNNPSMHYIKKEIGEIINRNQSHSISTFVSNTQRTS
ncbi:uncharacterized protein LOC116180675 isoform X2 [Photinus pyralis]|uniref:uncharacterized protein LOC116180675 isoform X2 n=1 Tax=Photinus pyralis TaxID=7054 RepID=UPI0012670A0D|nr:uncharacterized protein LOC116180675 isoform X2 [Photinus pyralis]XP_031356644.1 uncharacterized protein LOC116180675 isoform X2 [Photinus pyralis]XP_031356645.1 uncharacterized protein LOC116180675 isoform X2 [Photinus pyralis]